MGEVKIINKYIVKNHWLKLAKNLIYFFLCYFFFFFSIVTDVPHLTVDHWFENIFLNTWLVVVEVF